jgi:AcrR family transcriptional regulator
MAADSKSKLLLSAFEEFAKNGFWGASTRDIAAKANINISSILYYFGGKKGIYTATLQKIVDVVTNRTSELTTRYQAVVETQNPQEARELLKEMLERFLDLLCSSEISADLKKVFLSEYSRPTEEFNILYDELIKPVHDRLAQLLYLASNQKFEMKNCYFYIVTVFSQLFVFASRKEAICHLMEWSDYDEQAQTHLRNYTNAQIDFILDHMPLV